MPYCIYTDAEVSKNEGNFDHIVPISLGGKDDFCVWSSKQFNAKMGSRIDGAIANDPFVMLARRNLNVRGHSGKAVKPVWKRSKIGEKPVQVKLGKEKIEIWDPREKRYLDDNETAGTSFESKLTLNQLVPWQFAAKIALAGGYWLFGKKFSDHFDCEKLRSLISLDLSAPGSIKWEKFDYTVMDRFHEDSLPGGRGAEYRFLCEFKNRTTLIFVPFKDGVSIHVGVVGNYLASLIINGDDTIFPLSYEFDLGIALLLGPGKTEKISFRELAHRALLATNSS
jgi:hypothetical protein